MGYEPDGPCGMALTWLKSALTCKSFIWDADQHEYATKTHDDAEVWLKSTLARLEAYEAALRLADRALETIGVSNGAIREAREAIRKALETK